MFTTTREGIFEPYYKKETDTSSLNSNQIYSITPVDASNTQTLDVGRVARHDPNRVGV